MKKYRLAIFASGQGTNVENITTYFKDHREIEVTIIVTNNPQAGVISRAQDLHIPVEVISNDCASNAEFLVELCRQKEIHFVVLAGYLRMIPEKFVKTFHNRIINIHPSLLPKFGGKGMYGDNVHRAVLSSAEKESGITIHYVNAVYDEGEIIEQAKCTIDPTDTLERLKEKIAALEKVHFPKAIEQAILTSRNDICLSH